MNSIERFCFNLLGHRMKGKRDEYAQLRNDMLSARFKTPFEVYLSTAFVVSIVVGLAFALILGALSWV
ncbi:MAG: secretion system protein, partial [Methanoregula sp.]